MLLICSDPTLRLKAVILPAIFDIDGDLENIVKIGVHVVLRPMA